MKIINIRDTSILSCIALAICEGYDTGFLYKLLKTKDVQKIANSMLSRRPNKTARAFLEWARQQ